MGIPGHLRNHHIFAGGRWGAMSGEKPLFPAHFEAAHEKLVGVLRGMGLHHHETHGRYAEPERSVIVYSPSRRQMYRLGKMFGQESVVYSEGGRHELLYTNGEHDGKSRLVAPGVEPVEFFHEPPEDFYTHLPGHGYFRVNFDFDNPPQHLHESGSGGMPRIVEGLRAAAGGLQKSVAALPVQPALRPHPHSYDWHDGHTDHHRPTDPLSPVPGLRKGDVVKFPGDKVPPSEDRGRPAPVVGTVAHGGHFRHVQHEDRHPGEPPPPLETPVPQSERRGPRRAQARELGPLFSGRKEIPFPGNPEPAVDQGREAEVLGGPRPAGAFLKEGGSIVRRVQNLGWLLRNWQKVSHFKLSTHPDGGGHMVAHLHDGRTYETPWADHGLMRDWLNRPVFRGLVATVDGQVFRIGEGLNKSELRKDQQGHPHMDAPPKPPEPDYRDQNAPVGVSSYHRFAAPYGHVNRGQQTNLLHYRYENKLPEIEELVKRHGYRVYYAGGKYGKPDLHARNYNTGHLMVYDPTSANNDFGEEHYTRAWRQIHELAHALTYKELNGVYGEGRRLGKLGHHRTLNEAMRAVHWEWLAAYRQRELSKQVGVHLSDDDFHRELNTVMHDALHRAVTGKFTEPSGEGFAPHPHKVELSTAMDVLREEAAKLGLRGHHDLLQRKSEAETVIFFEPRTADMPDPKTYTPEEAAALLVKAAREKIAGLAAELRELRHRELAKAQKSLVPPHKHTTGLTVSAGVEDVPPGKLTEKGEGGSSKVPCDCKHNESLAGEHSFNCPNNPGHKTAKADTLCKECGKEHLGKCGEITAAKTEGSPAESSPPEPDEYRCPDCDELTYGPGSCPECRKKHGLDKAMLTDAKGRVKDNGVHPDSKLPEDADPKHVNKPGKSAEEAGSGGHIRRGKSLKSIRKKALKKAMAELPDGSGVATGTVGKAEERPGAKCPKCGEDHKGVDHATAVLFGPDPKPLHPSDTKARPQLPRKTKKAEPPMAKPPSGKNPATMTPTSKPGVVKSDDEGEDADSYDIEQHTGPERNRYERDRDGTKKVVRKRPYRENTLPVDEAMRLRSKVAKALGDPAPEGGSRGGAPRPKPAPAAPKLGTNPLPKPAAPAAPPQATGSARISAVGQQPIAPTSVSGLASPKAAGVAAKPGIFGRMAAKMGKAELGGARVSPTLVPKPKLKPGVTSPYDTEGPAGTAKDVPKTVVARPSKM